MPTIGKPARVEGAVTGGASRGGDGRVVTTGGRVRFRLTDFLGRVITTIPQRSTRDTIGHQVGQCNPRNMMGALNVFDGHVPIGLLLDLSVLLEFLAKGLMYRWGCVEAPSGVEPLHRSFAARPMTRRPLTIQSDRLRRQMSEIKRFDHSCGDQL